MRIGKKFITTIAAVVCFGSFFANAAENQNGQNQRPPILLVKKNRGASTIRPKAPDRQVITCAYDGDALHLNFALSEGAATVHVTDETLITTIFEIDTTPLEATIIVGCLEGACTIEMETEKNNTYSGTIE